MALDLDREAFLMALSSLVHSSGWKLVEAEIHKMGASENAKLLNPKSEGGRSASENALYVAGRVAALQWLAKLPHSLQEQLEEEAKSVPEMEKQ